VNLHTKRYVDIFAYLIFKKEVQVTQPKVYGTIGVAVARQRLLLCALCAIPIASHGFEPIIGFCWLKQHHHIQISEKKHEDMS
jgi:hypothetical protein